MRTALSESPEAFEDFRLGDLGSSSRDEAQAFEGIPVRPSAWTCSLTYAALSRYFMEKPIISTAAHESIS